MLERFRDIAYSLGLEFQFGNIYDLEDYSKDVKEDAPLLFFYDCYQTTKLVIDQKSGYLLRSIPLSIYILSPSNLTDETERRLAQMTACSKKAISIYKMLDEAFTVSGAQLDPVVTATSRSLDGVRLSATLTTNQESLC